MRVCGHFVPLDELCGPKQGHETHADGRETLDSTLVSVDHTDRRVALEARLSQRAGGTFPAAQVVAFVTNGGASIAAHGSSEMPVWGPIFKGLDNREEVNAARIENLVKYLESIQARAKGFRRPQQDTVSLHRKNAEGRDEEKGER